MSTLNANTTLLQSSKGTLSDLTPAPVGGPSHFIHYLTDNVQPPSGVYVSLDDQLIVAVNVPTFALPITVRTMVRVLRPDGVIQPEQFDDVVTSTSFFIFHTLSEGFLLSVSALCLTSTVVSGGAVYYRAALVRGKLPTPDLQISLISSYVSNSYTPAWPNAPLSKPQDGSGRLRVFTSAAPAAGADFTVSVPGSARWRFMGLRAQLTASATVANRQVRIVVDDGVNTFYATGEANLQTAGQAIAYNFAPGAPANIINSGEESMPAPIGMMLGSGWRIRSITTAIDVADQWTTQQVGVEEFVEL